MCGSAPATSAIVSAGCFSPRTRASASSSGTRRRPPGSSGSRACGGSPWRRTARSTRWRVCLWVGAGRCV
eukprot:7350421-Lingulodinium_polyedra.AAC.1